MPRRTPVLLALAVAVVLAAAIPRDAAAYDSATWYEGAEGWDRALRQQRAHRVPILVYFRVDWCPHCHALDELLEDDEVYARLRHVIKVRIDPEDGDDEQELFAGEFGARGFPALFLVRDGSRRRLSASRTAEDLLAQLPGAK